MSLSVDMMQDIKRSNLTITEVTYFPDQSPTVVDLSGVVEILKDQADITSCPS
jgi:hypothetical protein